MSVDRKTVLHMANLARIEVPEADVDALAAELAGIIRWVERLEEVDTANVEPMTAAIGAELRWRADEVTDGGIGERVVANAPDAENGMFAVPKVIE